MLAADYEVMWDLVRNIPQASKWSTILGVSSLVFLVAAKVAKKRVHPPAGTKPLWYRIFKLACCFAPVIALILGALIAYELTSNGEQIKVVGPIKGGLSECFRIPKLSMSMVQKLFVSCLAIAFLGYIESISVAYRFASTRGYRVDASQELIALGMANVAGSFCSGYIAAGSFTKTAVAAEAGSKTPFHNIMITLVIVTVLAFMKEPLQYIPKCVLAAIIEVACIALVEVHQFVHAYKVDKKDFMVMLITAIATLFFEIDIGLGVGLVMSLFVLIHNLSAINASLLGTMGVGSGGPSSKGRPRVFRSLSTYNDAQELDTIKVG